MSETHSNSSDIAKRVQDLRSSLEHSDLVPKNITDKELTLFLYASEMQVDVARKTLQTYYDSKLQAPEHFAGRDPMCNEIQQCLDNQHYFILSPEDKNMCPIIFHQLSNSKPSNYNFDNAIKTFFMSIDICLDQYGNLPAKQGIIFLFDMRHVRIGHLTRVRIGSIKKFFRYVQEGMPAKLREIHVLNVVPFFDKILSLIRPFMRAEIMKVLHTYPSDYNMNEFYQNVISKKNLPKDFGGDLASADEIHNQFRKEYTDRREYFLKEESTMISRETNIVNSFKKLDID